MKEQPILFSTPMVKAILEGRKTQTRRVIKHAVYAYLNGEDITPKDLDTSGWLNLSPYQVDQRLWVRESFQIPLNRDGTLNKDSHPIYKADLSEEDLRSEACDWDWRPSIFMPRWASRITLEVTEVRVQRLQEIGWADTLAEGIISSVIGQERVIFKALWDSINAKRGYSWESNTRVWAISFKRIK